MLVTLAGQKGGGGKSTIAVNLAAEWLRRGRRVLLVDADPQGSALTWAEVAAERGHEAPAVVALGDNIRQALAGLAGGYEIVVVDTAGRQSARLAGALALADVALLPCQPSPADVWALAGSVETITAVQQLRPELRAAVIVNGKSRTAIARGVRSAIARTGLPVLGAELGQRVAFAEALATGQGITAYAPGSVAANELRRLADAVEDFVSAKGAAHVA